MKEIPLTRGYVAIVDDEDYPRLMEHSWYAEIRPTRVYAARGSSVNGKKKRHYMHREVMNAGPETEVDHREGPGLDNRKGNLRFGTHQQNMANRGPDRTSKTGLKGVTFYKGKYRATIGFGGKQVACGRFSTPEAASAAYLAKATELFGEFARV